MTLFSDPSVGIADPMLRRAYALAEHGRGTTSPNPLVGCVVVRDGQIVGEGFHERAGGPHGKTPPCVDRLHAEGVSAVTIGMRDPSEQAGGGADALAKAGVQVSWAEDPAPFERQNEAWLTRQRLGRPFVRVKVALTLDGRPALAARRRSRITGAGGRSITMRLRAEATGIAVGASTLCIDDPKLTVRGEDDEAEARSPRRFVLSRTTVPVPTCCAFNDSLGCTLVTSSAASPVDVEEVMRRGVAVLTYPYAEALHGALGVIAAAGVNDVLVEAGPSLFSAFWRDRLIDELVVVTAGGMSGNAAPPLFLGPPTAEGDDLAPLFVPVETGIVGDDVVTVWRPRP